MTKGKANLFDFDFTIADSINEIVDLIFTDLFIEQNRCYSTLITPNAFQIVQYNKKENKYLKEFYKNSPIILPDGAPIVWLSKILKKENRLKHRLPGSDLFPVLWNKIKQEQITATLVLTNETIALNFKQDYVYANCLVPNFFSINDTQYIKEFACIVADKIIATNSRFLFLGISYPKQEILGTHICNILKEKGYKNTVWVLLLGASFEFYFGIKKRAPSIVQKYGFEWLYRFIKEPKRLWKRYTIDNIVFIYLSIIEICKKRM